MKKLTLTLMLFMGVTTFSFACDLALEYWHWEACELGFDSLGDAIDAYDDWVDVAC